MPRGSRTVMIGGVVQRFVLGWCWQLWV